MAERASGKRKNKGKNKASGSKPGAGHNSGAVPDEVYRRWLPKVEIAKKALDKATDARRQKNGEYRAILKAAKDDGCNVEAIVRARDLHDQDHTIVVVDYYDIGRVLRIIKSPLVTQLELFADQDLPAPANARLAGYHAGKNGEGADNNPYQAGTDEHVQWREGCCEGQASIVSRMGDEAGAEA